MKYISFHPLNLHVFPRYMCLCGYHIKLNTLKMSLPGEDKPYILDFLVCLGVCHMILTIFGKILKNKICPYRLLGEILAANWPQKLICMTIILCDHFWHEKVPKIVHQWCNYLAFDLRNRRVLLKYCLQVVVLLLINETLCF